MFNKDRSYDLPRVPTQFVFYRHRLQSVRRFTCIACMHWECIRSVASRTLPANLRCHLCIYFLLFLPSTGGRWSTGKRGHRERAQPLLGVTTLAGKPACGGCGPATLAPRQNPQQCSRAHRLCRLPSPPPVVVFVCVFLAVQPIGTLWAGHDSSHIRTPEPVVVHGPLRAWPLRRCRA